MDFKLAVSRNIVLTIVLTLFLLSGINSQRTRYSNPNFGLQRPDNDPILFSYQETSGYSPTPQYSGREDPQFYPQIAQPQPPSQSFDNVADGVTDFSLNMLKDLTRNPRGNIVTSPISMATVLALLQQGATGNSLKELSTALKMNKDVARNSFAAIVENVKAKKSKNDISFANAVFVDRQYRLNPAFNDTAVRAFRAQVEPVDFRNPGQAAARVNDWVNRETFGRVPSILKPDSIDASTHCVLANAVYFKGVWKHTFATDRTVNRDFQPTPGENIMCSFMHQSGKFSAGEDKELGAKWLELPFDKHEFAMVLVLPTAQHELNSLIHRMTSEDLKTILTPREPVKVTMAIPKFNINFETSLVNTLKNMGIRQIFSRNSGLTELAQNEQVQVSQAVQRAGIAIDELGSVAAAASALAVNTLSLSSYLDEFRFTANQPFLAMIVDRRNNVPLFLTRIDDPSKPF